ncbi:MAG: sigma-54-dependent transcriptional regulator [Gammaproteobacteria bacterium]
MNASQILVVDDESDIRGLLQEILTEEGYEVSVAADASEARSWWQKADPDLVLLDIWMPDTDGITLLKEWADSGSLSCPVVMMSGHGTVETAVEATRLGAFDFVEKPLSLAKLLKTVERALDSGSVRRRDPVRQLVPRVLAPVGKSAVMRALREEVTQVARHSANVLLSGESGTGREAFARYLHSLSPRAGGPFVTVVCSAMDDDNAAAMLLGSDDEPGFLARAEGGTLFLNRIEDLCDRAQRLLLGVLETGAVQTPQGRRNVDALYVSSSGPGIERPEAAPNLRAELIAQLGVIRVRIPPLREYSEDVPELLNHFSDKLADSEGLVIRKFSVAAQNRLRNFPWPGNIRDLRNLVHRLLMTGDGESVSLDEVERHLGSEPTENMPLVKQDLLALPLREAREQFERAYLKQQLSLCGGKVGKLAQRVGMERTHLYRKLRTLGVDFGHSNSDD